MMVVDDMASIPARNRQSMRLQPKRLPTAVPVAIMQKMIVSVATIGASPMRSIFLNEKSRPRAKRRKSTPMSAHVCMSALSTTDMIYGMWGLTRKPATIYPSTMGWRSFLNSSVTRPATTSIRARSCMRAGIWDMVWEWRWWLNR